MIQSTLSKPNTSTSTEINTKILSSVSVVCQWKWNRSSQFLSNVSCKTLDHVEKIKIYYFDSQFLITMMMLEHSLIVNYVHSIINSLRPNDAYMRQSSNHHWLTQWLVAWSAPCYYLNQSWNIVNWTLRNKLTNFNRNSYIFMQENAFKNFVCEMASILSRPQCVKQDKGYW